MKQLRPSVWKQTRVWCDLWGWQRQWHWWAVFWVQGTQLAAGKAAHLLCVLLLSLPDGPLWPRCNLRTRPTCIFPLSCWPRWPDTPKLNIQFNSLLVSKKNSVSCFWLQYLLLPGASPYMWVQDTQAGRRFLRRLRPGVPGSCSTRWLPSGSVWNPKLTLTWHLTACFCISHWSKLGCLVISNNTKDLIYVNAW